MPRRSALRCAPLEDLAAQLRFAPPQTLRKQIERLEELSPQLDPARNYPQDWLVYRLTGLRPEGQGPPVVLVGEALLGDLSALAERLSDAAHLTPADLEPGRFLSVAELAARWSVSVKTIDRLRREGLVARRVREGGMRARLVFHVEHVRAFEGAHGGRLPGGARAGRVDAESGRAMAAEVLALCAREGWSLSRAAREVARRHGRAHETVRRAVLRHGGPERRGAMGARERALVERASFAGIDEAAIARRVGRGVRAVRRVANDARARRLAAVLGEMGAAGGDPGALGHPGVLAGLGARGETDAMALVRAGRAAGAPIGALERVLAEAAGVLVSRAAAMARTLPRRGAGAVELDLIETDLRWASRLRAELVRMQLGTAVRALESAVGRPLDEVRPGALAALVSEALDAAAEAAAAFDPRHGGRLAGAVGLAVTRVGTRALRERGAGMFTPTGRASAAGAVEIADWTRRVAAWRWLEPHERVRAGAERAGGEAWEVLSRRYGWGPRPHTVVELAEWMGVTAVRAAVRVKGVERAVALGIRH